MSLSFSGKCSLTKLIQINSDAFYIQFFQSAFPDIDFSSLEETNNEEEMAMNI